MARFYSIMVADVDTNLFKSILGDLGLQPLPTYEKEGETIF